MPDLWAPSPGVLSQIRLLVAVIILPRALFVSLPPKVRSLDGVVCVLLCVGHHPCRLHVVLHKMSNLPDLQKSYDVSDEGSD